MNSVNPYRLQGQKTCAFEHRGRARPPPGPAPRPGGQRGEHLEPLDGVLDYLADGTIHEPRWLGFQAAGAAPSSSGNP